MMNRQIPALLQEAVLKASSDYYRWSHGRNLYDSGIEHLMEVYAAQVLYDSLSKEEDVIIELQYDTHRFASISINCPPNFRHGRIDLILNSVANREWVFVEFKRYLNEASIQSDIERLVHLTQAVKSSQAPSTGYLVGPMYQYQGSDHDFQASYNYHMQSAKELWKSNSIITAFVGEEKNIVDFESYQGSRDRHLSIVVKVVSI